MKKLTVITFIISFALATIASAETDWKNAAAGAGAFGLTRSAARLIENTKSWQENDTPEPAKIIGINVASAVPAMFAAILVESLQHNDPSEEIRSDQNYRFGGAAIACGITITTQLIYYYATRNR